MAKVALQKPEENAPEITAFLVLRDDWLGEKPDCIRVYQVNTFCPDLIDMHEYRTFEAIGIPREVPIAWIRAFKWASEEEQERFWDIHRYKEPN